MQKGGRRTIGHSMSEFKQAKTTRVLLPPCVHISGSQAGAEGADDVGGGEEGEEDPEDAVEEVMATATVKLNDEAFALFLQEVGEGGVMRLWCMCTAVVGSECVRARLTTVQSTRRPFQEHHLRACMPPSLPSPSPWFSYRCRTGRQAVPAVRARLAPRSARRGAHHQERHDSSLQGHMRHTVTAALGTNWSECMPSALGTCADMGHRSKQGAECERRLARAKGQTPSSRTALSRLAIVSPFTLPCEHSHSVLV